MILRTSWRRREILTGMVQAFRQLIFIMTQVINLLMGPTASGKTDFSVELVLHNPQLEIVSVDSALVYRGLDIGTAKPSREILATIPHHLIDICDLAEPYSAGNFRQNALQAIADIHRRGKIPLLVGGTMLYFWVLEHGLAPLPPANTEIRAKMSEEAARAGWPALHQQLQQVDPAAAAKISPQDGQRIQRALEIFYLTGKPISVWQQETDNNLPFNIRHFILAPPRETLYQRIHQRLQTLFDRGFIDEVQALRARPEIHADLPAMRTVGYRQIWEYLDGQYDLPTLHERAYHATCQLAKRQFTWLRRWEKAKWLSSGNYSPLKSAYAERPILPQI
jgi:tRNA dimethylallyltransferase